MGIAHLWTELVKYAHVCRSWNGAARSSAAAGDGRDSNTEIVAELCGKVLAIDTSVWLFQCSQQSDLKEAIFDEHARVLYIIIFRIMNLLRYGVTPLFVLEGVTPEAKMGRLNQRSLARGLSGRAVGNRRGGRHDSLGRKLVELLDHMGIPHVEAPGEAEAMCAALNSVGLAHAAVTSDVDALLFGARRVYRECRVQMDNVKMNVLERVDAAEASRRCFGLRDESATCVRALQAVGCLSGCDYSVAGGKGVGVKTALEAVQQLTVGRQDDSHVIPELLTFLETGPDPRITALTKCTGCKTCGHEKHGRLPCPICGGPTCLPKADSSPCECEFHRSEPQRKFMRVIARAITTGPSFTLECRATIAAFELETERALRAAEDLRRKVGSISWSRRPNVQGVFQLMHPLLGSTSSDPNRLLWTYAEVRDKMRPVLVEWDMRQGPKPCGEVQNHVEFCPRRIKQVAAKDGGMWAYIMEFDRITTVNPADAEFDIQQLANSKLVKGRHVRRTLVDRLWPHLLQMKEEEQAKLIKPKRVRGKAGADTATVGSPGSISGPGPSGRIPSGPVAVSSRGGATRSGTSAGSSDVMHRFLRMGSTAGGAVIAGPINSIQQLPSNCDHQGVTQGATSSRGKSYQQEDFGNDDMDFEVQMTQHNDGQGQGARAGGGGDAADGAEAAAGEPAGAGPSQPDGIGQAGGRAPLGKMVALWRASDADEELTDSDDHRRTAEGMGQCAQYDDLHEVIPTSLDELLASASQPSGRNRDVAREPKLPPAAGCQGDVHGPGAQKQRGERPPMYTTAADVVGAATRGSPNELPFRPQPTGPGPGHERCAPSSKCNSRPGGGHFRTAPAVANNGHPRFPAEWAQGGVGGGHCRVVEVMDLTDSPAAMAPVARSRPQANATSGPSNKRLVAVNEGTGGSGEDCLGLNGQAHVEELHLSQQQRRQSGLWQGRDIGVHGGTGEEGGLGEEQEDDMEHGQGSAVKPRAYRPRRHELEEKQSHQPQPQQQQEGAKALQQEELQPSLQVSEYDHPAAPRVRLMRNLFPEKTDEEAAAALAARSRTHPTDLAWTADGPARTDRLQQQQPEQGLRPDDAILTSPSKKRITSDEGVSGVCGCGAVLSAGPAVKATIAAAAEHVDLTLDDDDEVVDLT